MGVKCAKCGSHNTAEYLYGMPAMNEKLEKEDTKNIFRRNN